MNLSQSLMLRRGKTAPRIEQSLSLELDTRQEALKMAKNLIQMLGVIAILRPIPFDMQEVTGSSPVSPTV